MIGRTASARIHGSSARSSSISLREATTTQPQQATLRDDAHATIRNVAASAMSGILVGKMKQFATYFTHGVRNGSKLRVEIYKTTDAAQILDSVDAFFERELAGVSA
jgi:tRNA-dihydrouridine synthase